MHKLTAVPPATRAFPGAHGIVITGASSGIGAACALALDRLGFTVCACVLPGEDTALLRAASKQLRTIDLDVTDVVSVQTACAAVQAHVGEAGLRGLVNVAGVSIPGPIEFLPLEDVRRQLEVNVIGQVAVTQAFLPLIRKGSGRIVMMGSALGGLGYPIHGPYAASKAALRVLTDALRLELRPWAIEVSLVLPGIIDTPIWSKATRGLTDSMRSLPRQSQDLYSPAIARALRSHEKVQRVGDPAALVARAVCDALLATKPKRYYLVGRGARLAELLRVLPLPGSAIDWIILWSAG
jgi:NAD(P)-dependent dehydrogenase (short-subunit alcohol dehydrogenase family)